MVEVDLPAAPLDAGLALGLFLADGCVDHLHEEDHDGESLPGLGAPKGREDVIHVQPGFMRHKTEKAVDLAHQKSSDALPPVG